MIEAWILGVVLNLIGSVLFNLAVNLLKLVSDREKVGIKSSLFVQRIAWVVLVVGSLSCYTSFAFASSSLLASLGGAQLVSNLFFSRMHSTAAGKGLTKYHCVASFLLVFGMTVCAIFASHDSNTYTNAEITLLYTAPAFLTLEVVLLALLIFNWFWIERRDRRIATAYAFSSAVVGTQSTLHSKVLAEMLKDAFLSGNVSNFQTGLFYIVLLACLVTMSFWIYRLSRSLALFDGLVIIPLLQVAWVLSATLQGSVLFQEFASMSWLYFSVGLAITATGIYLLTKIEQRALKPQWNPLVDISDPVWGLVGSPMSSPLPGGEDVGCLTINTEDSNHEDTPNPLREIKA